MVILSKYTKIFSSFEINSYLISRINERSELVVVLLKTLQNILLGKNNVDMKLEKRYGEILYYTSPKRTNRVIYLLYEEEEVYQAVSIVNPFRLINREEEFYFKLDLNNSNRDVYYFDYMSLQFYIEILENGWMNKKVEKNPKNAYLNHEDENLLFDMANFYDYISNKCIEFKMNVNEYYNEIHEHTLSEVSTWKIIRYFMMYELGYFRYDLDDSERTDEHYHPLHHFDINYSEVGTYKLGIEPSRLYDNGIIDLITKLISESDETKRHYLN